MAASRSRGNQPPEPRDRPDVFVSYAREDKEFVERRLTKALVERGKDVWIDVEDIRGGASDWRASVWAGIESAKVIVFVLTPDSLASTVCARGAAARGRAEQADHSRAAAAGGRAFRPAACSGGRTGSSLALRTTSRRASRRSSTRSSSTSRGSSSTRGSRNARSSGSATTATAAICSAAATSARRSAGSTTRAGTARRRPRIR